MNTSDKIELFEKTSIPKAIAKLAIPTILSSLVMVFYNLADTYFVGMLNDPIENAAVTFVAPVLLAFNAVNNLFGVGCSSLMSRSLGARHYRVVKKTSAIGFYCTLFFAAVISLGCIFFSSPLISMLGADQSSYQSTFDYMKWTVMFGAIPAILNVVLAYMVRSEGASLHASIGTMSGCFLNIILDPIFILPWGLNMKAAGAGCATFLSNCVACLYFFILLKSKKDNTFISLNYHYFSFDKSILFSIFAVGVPASIQNLLNVTGMTILNNLASSYGTTAIAAMGITYKINMVPTQIALGLSQGVMPLISYCYASNNYHRMKNAILTSMKVCAAFALCASLLYYIKADFFIAMFMSNKEIIAYGSRFLRGYCLGIPFLTFDFLCVGVYQAIGNGKLSLFFAIARKIILEIPALLILNMLFPLYGLAYSQFTAEFILTIAAMTVMVKLFKQMSLHNTQ